MSKTGSTILTRLYPSPCGMLTLGSLDGRLCLCDWPSEERRKRIALRLRKWLQADMEEGPSAVTDEAARQLDEYFAGQRRTFSVPLLFAGTDFQQSVWNELLRIPYGHAVSYGEMAQRMGMPRAVRAVANANAANAISIFAPCHRVIGSDGTLTGYAGGIGAKRRLLCLEGLGAFRP